MRVVWQVPQTRVVWGCARGRRMVAVVVAGAWQYALVGQHSQPTRLHWVVMLISSGGPGSR